MDPHDQVKNLPVQPGIYKFINSRQQLIYVGKAKNLKKRVASYFSKSKGHNKKTQRLVKEIDQIQFVVTGSEFDALLLENNLIKVNQPKYNILLKDDKSFPFICVTNERFPRVFSTRRIHKPLGTYYGPYTSVVAMNNVLELLRKLYTLRTCKYNLSEKNVRQKKYKVCLEYHIGNCLGPCEGLQSEENYLRDIEHVEAILKGKLGIVRSQIKHFMNDSASTLDFEKANIYKEKLLLLEKFQSKSLVVNPSIDDIHVFTIVEGTQHRFVNYLQIKGGSIIQSQTKAFKSKLDEPLEETLGSLIGQFLLLKEAPNRSIQVLSNVLIQLPREFEVVVPKIGDKRKLVELSLKNAYLLKLQETKHTQSQQAGRKTNVLEMLQQDLSLPHLPVHIECFDNSNLQGTHPVASMVCFKNGRPSKSEYRKFHIKTVVGPDDFASMKEIVTRRYSRLVNENQALPNLVLVDGGKGQLHAATEALKSIGLYGKMPIAGIAKRLEEIYLPNDPYPVHINKKSASLKLLQQIRDEAHRFAITFHRQKRRSEIGTSLTDIPGVGTATAGKLIKRFKSLAKIKQASLEDLSATIGKAKAQTLKKNCYLKNLR